MVEKAKAGIYTQFEVQRGLPITHLVKYFRQVGDKWQLSDKIRQMVTFREYNLLTDLTPRWPVRRGVLPQCADLLRPADQGQGPGQHREADAG